jgi:hypothetical protein
MTEESTDTRPQSSKDSEVVISNNDSNWVESHNAVAAPAVIDPAVEVERAEDTLDDSKAETTASDEDATREGSHSAGESSEQDEGAEAPPLPEEEVPPLPSEAPPLPVEAPPVEDDGWAPVWDESAQAFYFYNRFTGATQWENPRVPEVKAQPGPPGAESSSRVPTEAPPGRVAGGYDPAIHGDYDLTAWYAKQDAPEEVATTVPDPSAIYAATGHFNRFTGRWQAADLSPENFNDENKSKRQMNAFFDVDAAANSHDGRSLKAERSGKKVSKAELKQFKEKRKAKKEEKRRAWLRD